MTQASLTADLESPIHVAKDADEPGRTGLSTEATLWLFGLTALTLVFASLLLLGLLTQNVLADAAVGGAVSAIASMAALLGIGALGYVLSTARRAGYLRAADDVPASSAYAGSTVAGLVVAPTITPDLGARKRLAAGQRRDLRTRQAEAIRTAEHDRTLPRAADAVASAERPVGARPPWPVPTAPRPSGPAPARPRPPAPARIRAAAPPAPRPVVRMPGWNVRTAPAAPNFLRMHRPPVQARTHATLIQVRATAARQPSAPTPWSVVDVPGRGLVYQPPRPGRSG